MVWFGLVWFGLVWVRDAMEGTGGLGRRGSQPVPRHVIDEAHFGALGACKGLESHLGMRKRRLEACKEGQAQA